MGPRRPYPDAGLFCSVASALGVRVVHSGLGTGYVAADRQWDQGFWSRRSNMDPLIVQAIRSTVVRGGNSE